jgi:nucleoside-diphosphate-sugar epimerase
MEKTNKIACVTGASGTLGRRIVQHLIKNGYTVRALSRKQDYYVSGVTHFFGGLEDENILEKFVSDADAIFHCAAELQDESKMWRVNVLATKCILELSELAGIKYFCYLSSVGVIGSIDLKWVDELSFCNPRNMYEKSKWAAEQLVARGINGCKKVILRPTNIVDEKSPGILSLPLRGLLRDFCKVFLTGGECAHIVHAEDVAEAAAYFISRPPETPQCYIVSCDHEPLNTLSGLWALYNACRAGKSADTVHPVLHLPLFVPYVLRRIIRGMGNKGDVRYSSKKLMETGFIFRLGVKGAVNRIALASGSRTV